MEKDKLFEAFYEEIKHKYPDLTFKDVQRICNSIFVFTNRAMTLIRLPTIRWKYLGKIGVKIGMAKASIKAEAGKLKAGAITKDQHDTEVAKLNNVIRRNESEDESEEC